MNQEDKNIVQPVVQDLSQAYKSAEIRRMEKGRFAPGRSPNPSGRGKGTLNAETKTIKNLASAIIEDNAQQFQRDIKKLRPFQRVQVILQLLEYVAPKLQRVTHEGETGNQIIQVFKLGNTEIKF
jgi:hypothetical protein